MEIWLWVVGILLCYAAVKFYPFVMVAVGVPDPFSGSGRTVLHLIWTITLLVVVLALIRWGYDFHSTGSKGKRLWD